MPFTDKDHLTSPRVTVIVAVYNQAEFLPECLGSLRAQTISNWQAIIVDDASTIGDADAVVQAEKDSRFQLIRHDCNRGLAASRNTGIRAAQTCWVLCLDADDKLADDALETLLSLADRHLNGHAFFGDIQTFGVTNRAMPQTCQPPREFFTQRLMPGAGFLLRRDFWQSAGGYCEDETLKIGQEDTNFWIAAFEHGVEVYHAAKVTYLYHRHGDNMTSHIHPTTTKSESSSIGGTEPSSTRTACAGASSRIPTGTRQKAAGCAASAERRCSSLFGRSPSAGRRWTSIASLN